MRDVELRLHETWQQIAAQASKETDPHKLAKMIEELSTALKVYEESLHHSQNPPKRV